jgi:hypothetical protein
VASSHDKAGFGPFAFENSIGGRCGPMMDVIKLAILWKSVFSFQDLSGFLDALTDTNALIGRVCQNLCPDSLAIRSSVGSI